LEPGRRIFDRYRRLYALQRYGDCEAPGSDGRRQICRRIRKTGKRTVWNGVVREDRVALSILHRWRKPRKIFVNSMSDLFHEGVSDAFILNVW
jgi:protein gp37